MKGTQTGHKRGQRLSARPTARRQSAQPWPPRPRLSRAITYAVFAALAPSAVPAQTLQTSDAAPPAAPPPLNFDEAFATFGPPQAPSLQSGAVDLSTFTPPRPPKPKVTRSLGTVVASYYGKRFHGRLTANGERFNMNAMTAAHKTLPFGTRLRVTNLANGRSVTVRINDRGPYIAGRTIDLSRGAAAKIGMIHRGHARVKADILAR